MSDGMMIVYMYKFQYNIHSLFFTPLSARDVDYNNAPKLYKILIFAKFQHHEYTFFIVFCYIMACLFLHIRWQQCL